MEKEQRLYHQISISNRWVNDAVYTGKDIVYNEALPLPLLEDCGEWEMGIDRFDIDSTYVPLYYWPVVPNDAHHGNTDWTMSNLIFTLEYGAFSFSQHVHLIQRNFAEPVPTVPLVGNPWPISPHYFIYYIDHLVEMFNAALAAAFVGLGLLVVLPGGSTAPYIIYNNSTRTFSFVCQHAFYRDDLPAPIRVWMNNSLDSIFTNWYVQMYPNDPVTHMEQRLVIANLAENIVVIGGANYLKIDQPYPNLYALCSFRYIEIRSNTIAVVKESRNDLDLYTNTQADLQKHSVGILTDFEVILSDVTAVRSSSWVYISKGKPNWITLTAAPDLSHIDLQVFLKDAEGRYAPLKLEPGKSATIKLVWRRRRYL